MSTINANSSGIVFTGNTDGTLDLATGGTTRMLIDGSGNVGIGTNTASFKITNNFDAPATWGNNANNFIEMWQNSGTNALGVAMGDDSIASFTTNNGYNLVLATDGVERMRVATSTGNVGIGTAPSYKLHVAGSSTNDIFGYFANSVGGSTKCRIAFQDASTTFAADLGCVGNNITFNTVGSERMRIDSSGNVGIGVATPAYSGMQLNTASGDSIFHITRTAQGTAGGDGFSIGLGNDGNGYVFLREASPLIIGTSNAERMRVTSGGDVGIGTSSPSSKLHTVGTTRSVANVGNGGATSILAVALGTAQGQRAGYSLWSTFENTGDNIPRRTADIYAGYNGGAWGTEYLIFAVGTGASNDGYDLNTERMRITGAGEVLVAGSTDNGAYNLQCNGTGVWGAGAYVNGSDARIKEDVNPISSGLDVIGKLNPVTYRYKESWTKDQSIQTGFIAQELLTALDGQVYVDGIVQQGGAEGYYSVAYQNIIPILTKAIQELTARVAELEAK